MTEIIADPLRTREVLAWGDQTLSSNGIRNSLMEALWLLAEDSSPSNVLAQGSKTIGNKRLDRFRALIRERSKGKPLAYLVKSQDFMGLKFYVDDSVLIPRPETVFLVHKAIELAQSSSGLLKILDIGTGAGIVAILLAKKITDADVLALDVSPLALQIGQRNAIQNDLDKRIRFIESDIFSSVKGKFDMIVSNPPYVSWDEFPALQKEIGFEPRLALDGGPEGLSIIKRIVQEAPKFLNQNGFLLIEVGHSQSSKVMELMKKSGFTNCSTTADDSGIERVVMGTRS